DSIFFLVPSDTKAETCLALSGFMNGYVYDWELRNRLGGTNLSWFVLEETACPAASHRNSTVVARIALQLSGSLALTAPTWLRLSLSTCSELRAFAWKRLWALTDHERLRLRCALDAIAAELYGLDWDDLSWILRECDFPVALLGEEPLTQ